MRNKLKEFTGNKKELEEILKKTLLAQGKDTINVADNCTIKLSSNVVKASIKEDLIKKAIIKQFDDTASLSSGGEQVATNILDEMNSMREVTTKYKIGVSKKKVGGGKKSKKTQSEKKPKKSK